MNFHLSSVIALFGIVKYNSQNINQTSALNVQYLKRADEAELVCFNCLSVVFLKTVTSPTYDFKTTILPLSIS